MAISLLDIKNGRKIKDEEEINSNIKQPTTSVTTQAISLEDIRSGKTKIKPLIDFNKVKTINNDVKEEIIRKSEPEVLHKKMPTFLEESEKIKESAKKYSKEPSKNIDKNKKQSKQEQIQAKENLKLAENNLITRDKEYKKATKEYQAKLSKEYKKNNINFQPKFESKTNKKISFQTKERGNDESQPKIYKLESVKRNSEKERAHAEDKLNELKFAQYQYDSAKVKTEDTTYFDRTLGNVVRGAKDLGSVFDISSKKYKDKDGKTYFLPSYNQLKQEKVSGDYKSGLGKILGDSTYNATKILGSTALDAITGGFGGKATYWTDMAADNFQNVKNQGYDNSKALANTLVSTGSEFLTEKILGAFSRKLTGGKSSKLSNIISDKASKIVRSPKAANIIGNAGSEAIEEFTQEYIDNLNRLVTLENSTDVNDYKKVFNKDTFKDALYSAGVGAVSGGALTTLDNRDGKQVDNNIKTLENLKNNLQTEKEILTNKNEIDKYNKVIENIDNYLSKPFSNNNDNVIEQIANNVSAFNLNQEQSRINKNSLNNMNNQRMVNLSNMDMNNTINKIDFSKQVDDVLKGTYPKRDMLIVSQNTPEVLQKLGIKNLPITMTQKHLDTIINKEGNRKNVHYHDLGVDLVKQIPEALSRPLNILKSNTKDDSIVVVTDLADNQERPVIASIKINGKGQINDIQIDTNVMTSAYGRNNYDKFMQDNIKRGNLLYDIDEGTVNSINNTKEKSDVTDRVQFPMRDSNSNTATVSDIPKNTSPISIDNISQQNNFVNSNMINNHYVKDTNHNNNINENIVDNVLKIDEHDNAKTNDSFDIQTIRDNQPYNQQLKSIESKIVRIQNEITNNPNISGDKMSELSNLINQRKEIYNMINSPGAEKNTQINPYIEMHNQLAEEGHGEKIEIPEYKDKSSDPDDIVGDNKKISIKALKEDNKVKGAVQELFVNKNYYIDKFSKDTGNQQIKYAGDQLNNFRGSADWNINVYQQDSNGNKIGDSLNEIFKDSKQEGIDKILDDYLIHKSNIDRSARNKGMANVTQAESLQFVQDIEKKYPQVKEYSNKVQLYIDNLRNRMVEAGLISSETAKSLKETNPNYVPYYEELDNVPIEIDANKITPKKVVKYAKGGASNILNIEKALGRYTYSVEKAIAQNDLYKEIVSTIKERENIGFDDRTDASDLSQSLYTDEKTGKKYLSAFFNGEMETAPITANLYNELDSKNHKAQQFVDYLEDSFQTPLNVVKKANNIRRNLLTTWNPTFFLTNPLKDIQDATINSTDIKGFTKNYFKAMDEAIKYSDDYMKFIAKYGIDSTQGIYSNDFNTKNKIDSGLKKKAITFTNKVASTNEILEMTPRYAEYMTTLENGGTLNEALYNAREVTTNFGRGGIITKALNNNGFTFLNASVQGFDKLYRNFSLQNGAKAFTNVVIKSIVIGMAPSVLNHLLLDDDEEYKDLSNYVKDNYYLFKMDDGKFMRLPKGRVLSVLGSAARRTTEGASGEKDSFDGFGTNAWNQVGFNDLGGNNLLSPMIQAFGSKNGQAWYGGDIVTSRLQKQLPKNQYDEKTDEFSIWLGDKLNISPKKINYALDQYSGGIGDLTLPLMTKKAENGSDDLLGKAISPLRDKFVTDSVINNKNVSNFYNVYEKLEQEKNDVKASDETILSYKYLDSKSKEMSELYNEKRKIENSNKKDSIKYKESRKIQEQINATAKNALKAYNKVKKNNNDYAIVGEFHYKKSKDKTTGEYKWTKQRKK